MTLRELQRIVDKHWPGAWAVTKNQNGFCLTRSDAVDLISCTEIAEIAAKMRGFRAYVTLETPGFIEDGSKIAVWLMAPHNPTRKAKAKPKDRFKRSRGVMVARRKR